MDRIHLKSIECRVRLGVPDWERKKRQKILVDVAMDLDLSKAGYSDDVHDTVNYAEVEQAVRARAESGEVKLAEKLARKICETVLSVDARIQSVSISLHKKPKVMPKTAEVIVEIACHRAGKLASEAS